MLLGLVNVATLLELCLLGWVIYGLLAAVYNVYFHPLRRFPGPLAARASDGWKLYMEVFRQESPVHLLQKLHQQYVRIRPNELHFSSANAYHDIYNPSARWDKDRVQYESVGADHSLVSLVPYEEAKQRKAMLRSLFSRRAVSNLQGLVRREVGRLVRVLEERNAEGKSSDLLMAFRCMALDAATDFCFGTSLDALKAPEFRAPLLVAMDAALPGFAVMKHFPLLRRIALSLPSWLVGQHLPRHGRPAPDAADAPPTGRQRHHAPRDPPVQAARDRVPPPPRPRGAAPARGRRRLARDRAVRRGQHAHVRGDPHRRRPDHVRPVPHPEQPGPARAPPRRDPGRVARLPRLRVARQQRAAPRGPRDAAFTHRDHQGVPAHGPRHRLAAVPRNARRGAPSSTAGGGGGATVGMSIYHVHHNGALFANPEHFDPDRWLQQDDKAGLDQWFVAFSRGPRSCPGSNLAWCEMYILLSTMLRTFDLRLDRTTANDLAWRDCLVPDFTGRHLHAWCLPSKE
ncbi:hypothetical protein PG994_010337 [Apiospora phragmitis]|uniref:Cytochrome P450 n=1 Tax=Apiospora phragmitis TaxID=2905665 RepID=A0ABR1TQ55_9PEZI